MSDPGIEPVRERLEALGFQVQRIAKNPKERRPDLRALNSGSTNWVEVKTRTLDSELRARMESVNVGATESILVPLDKRNWLSSDVKKASTQLDAAAKPDEFRLVWFRADNGLFVQDAREQIGATLLGIRMVFGRRNGERRVRHCVYAGFADFRRYTAIDGAMIEVDGALTLISNPFSPRQQAFATSPIHKAVEPAIVNVRQLEREDRCYIVDSDINRKDDEAILAFLRTKYPADEFLRFGPAFAGTTVTTIDARQGKGA